MVRQRLFAKRRLLEKVGEVGRRKALDVPDTNIAKEVVVTGRRLPPNETAEAISEFSFHSQTGELDRRFFIR
jgi:hypothetical protein